MSEKTGGGGGEVELILWEKKEKKGGRLGRRDVWKKRDGGVNY